MYLNHIYILGIVFWKTKNWESYHVKNGVWNRTRGSAKIWKIPSNRIGSSFKLKEKVRIETKKFF
jgi:hypothetical protein